MKLYELVDSLIRFANNNHSKDFNIWNTEIIIQIGTNKSTLAEIDIHSDDLSGELVREVVLSANDNSLQNEITTALEDMEFRRGEVLPKRLK